MSFCRICAARQREISSLSANVSISRRTLPPIHSRVRQSLSLKGNPSHGDPIRRVGRAGRSGRDKPDDRGSVGTSAQRALPRPHSRPPGPGPRRASRRHHAPPIWRVGVEQQYIAAGWTSTRSALLVFPQVGDFGPLPAQLRSHKSDSMIFLPGIPPWQIVSVIIVRCWGSGSRRRRAGTASAGLRTATCWPPSLRQELSSHRGARRGSTPAVTSGAAS